MRNIIVKCSIILVSMLTIFLFSIPAEANPPEPPQVTRHTHPAHTGTETGGAAPAGDHSAHTGTESTHKSHLDVKNMLGDLHLSTTTLNNKSGLFSGFVEKAMATGDVMAERYISIARGTTLILGSIALVWLGIMIMLSEADIWHMGLRPLFTLLFTVGFAYWLLEQYVQITTAVIEGFLYAAQVLIGGTKGGSTLVSLVVSLARNFNTMASDIMQTFALPAQGGTWEALLWIINNFINLAIDGIVSALLLLIFAVAFLLFLIIYLCYQIVAAIAIAVGPVFIPFLVLPITRPLFEGWVKMLIMSGIYLMTSTVIMGLMFTAGASYFSMDNIISTTGHGVDYSAVVNLWAAMQLIILEFVSIFALLKTHEFAHAIGGSVNISGMNAANGIVNVAKKIATAGMG